MKEWVILKETGGEFVANMEKVLDTYKLPYNTRTIPLFAWTNRPSSFLKV
jgi:hypothetical protein